MILVIIGIGLQLLSLMLIGVFGMCIPDFERARKSEAPMGLAFVCGICFYLIGLIIILQR